MLAPPPEAPDSGTNGLFGKCSRYWAANTKGTFTVVEPLLRGKVQPRTRWVMQLLSPV